VEGSDVVRADSVVERVHHVVSALQVEVDQLQIVLDDSYRGDFVVLGDVDDVGEVAGHSPAARGS